MLFKPYIMDVRNTVVTPEVFLDVLLEYQENHQDVSLLIEKDGLTRAEGHIVNIHAEKDFLKSKIELDNGSSFVLEDVVAVNGMFRSDYSEC